MNLARTQARRDVAAAGHTDPDVPWDGRVGGLHGDRGSLARLGGQLSAGATTLAHVHAAVSALASIPTPLRRGSVTLQVRTEAGEVVRTRQRRADLLDAFFAHTTGTRPLGTTRQLIDDVLTTVDPDRADRHARDLEPDSTSRRALTFTRRYGMLRMTVDLDEHAAVIVRAAVDTASRPEPNGDDGAAPDTRSTTQRRHDGLLDLLTTGAHHPASAVDPVVAHKATVVLRATLGQDGTVDTTTVTADGHGPVGRATVLATTCDADLSVAVMDRLGRPRSLHTLDRHASTAQRLLVAERDRGCTAPGCGAPAWACHHHHVVHWADGGPTSVDNLVLLCGRHHRSLHSGRLEARFAEDGLPETRTLHRDPGGLTAPGPWTRNDHPGLLQAARNLTHALHRDAPPERTAGSVIG
ncbi:HNH endonuclease [Kineococcus sp. LSe6-4]|uniref:HNH endonuclease n=1 Tax=Kineococcus halophytocola TaxID=3234027 RepID=A0ABV4H634_9ACTN